MADHNELGKQGEALALKYLSKIGYKIIKQNWRFSRFEIDIIARHEEYLIIVEVKTRNTDLFGQPESFVGRAQQSNLAEAVEAFLDYYPQYCMEVRYDVVSVIITQEKELIEHFPDAFWPDNLGNYSIE